MTKTKHVISGEDFETTYFHNLREERRDTYGARSMQLLNLLDEHSANWIMSIINQRIDRQGSALDAQSLVDESLHHLVSKASNACVLISASRQLLFSSEAAIDALKNQTSLVLDKGYLKGATPDLQKLFKQKVRKVFKVDTAAGKPAVSETLTLATADNEQNVFASIESIKLQAGKSAIAALYFHQPDNLPDINIARLRGWYNLSKREAALARAFATGTSLKDYAKNQGVAITTVRTQFAQIKTKMDAESQATVVRLTLLAAH